jgi:hypothetical protein
VKGNSDLIKGLEIMRMIRCRHCILIKPTITGEVEFINKRLDLAVCFPLQSDATFVRPPLMQKSEVRDIEQRKN